MTNPYPITRETREEAIFRGDGTASYGPFDLKIFDVLDVDVWTRADDAATWSEASPTVTKTSGLPFDTFSIAFPADIPATVRIKVQSKRVHERAAGVVNGTKIDPNALEKELSRLAATLQELRRDVDRGVQVQFGPGYVMTDDLEDGDTLMKSDARIVAGPNAASIAMAQSYAEAAEGFAGEAENAAEAALSAVPNAFPLTRAAMKALSTSTHISSYLLEPNREGVFRFKSGNFAAAVAADTNEGVYIAADDTAPNVGALVRLYQGAVSVRWFGATGDGLTDDRAACQAAIDYVTRSGGGDVHFPDGTYRLVGAANADGLANGLVIPFQSFSIDNRVRLLANGNATLKAASNNMVVVRVCQPGSEVIGLHVDGGYDYANPGGSLSGTWGIGLVPANRNQTTTLVSQSFCKVLRCHVRNCVEGLVLEPGPTVLGSQSGAFYPIIESNDFNLNRRSMWFKPSITDPTNRPTRGNIEFNRIERGNCGIDLEYATEFTLLGNNFQFFKSTYAATPISTACAIHVGANSEGNCLYGGEAEQCDNDIFNEGLLPNALRVPLGFSLGGINTGMTFSPVHQETFIRLARRTASYEQMYLAANFTGFARLVFDYTASNVRDAAIETNSVKRMDWFNGKTTHYGSDGNIELLNNGRTINGTASQGLAVATTGTNLSLSAGGKSMLLSASGFHPGADNSVPLGLTAFRFTQLSATTPTINTSDGTLKDWRGGLNDAELRVAKKLSKLIGIYRWKEAIAEKGDKARHHAGVIVQDVMAIFEAEGLDPFAYGMVCYDEWDDYTEPVTEAREVVILDAEGNPRIDESTGQPITETQEVETGETRIIKAAGHLYGLRYDELWAFVAAGFEARLTTLECS